MRKNLVIVSDRQDLCYLVLSQLSVQNTAICEKQWQGVGVDALASRPPVLLPLPDREWQGP